MLDEYQAQVALLLRVIPFVAQESCFALKGGTAINLFVQDMPRLSIDIDLCYFPFDERTIALKNIKSALKRIKNTIESKNSDLRAKSITQQDGNEATMQVSASDGTLIKIEVNTIMRGHVFTPQFLACTQKVSDAFETFVEINTISTGELYGGKICAALDRQHPRDLFDIHWLLKNGDINDEIKQGFMAALLSHPRPIHEVLNPKPLDQRDTFTKKFAGMAFTSFSYEDYEVTREQLADLTKSIFNSEDKQFLLSFKKGEPDWNLANSTFQSLPAIKWKLLNLHKLRKNNPQKHQLAYEKLKTALGSF